MLGSAGSAERMAYYGRNLAATVNSYGAASVRARHVENGRVVVKLESGTVHVECVGRGFVVRSGGENGRFVRTSCALLALFGVPLPYCKDLEPGQCARCLQPASRCGE